MFRGTNPALHAHWDTELGLFRPGEPAARWPVQRLGYMQVGVVTASRFAPLTEGQRVAMTYGHRTGFTADGLLERAVVLPDAVTDRCCTPPTTRTVRRCASSVTGYAGARW